MPMVLRLSGEVSLPKFPHPAWNPIARRALVTPAQINPHELMSLPSQLAVCAAVGG
jgi:hypothetical protein